MPKEFIKCVKELEKKIAKGDLPEGSNAYAICRKATGYYGTTHDIGLRHPKKK